MQNIRNFLIVVTLLLSGSALAYDGFTVGLQAERHHYGFGYNAHAIASLAQFDLASHPAALSLRADFSASALPYFGLAAVLSGAGAGIQPFVSLGGGAGLFSGPLIPGFQGLLGARVPLSSHLYIVVQFQLRIFSNEEAVPGMGMGLDYTF